MLLPADGSSFVFTKYRFLITCTQLLHFLFKVLCRESTLKETETMQTDIVCKYINITGTVRKLQEEINSSDNDKE